MNLIKQHLKFIPFFLLFLPGNLFAQKKDLEAMINQSKQHHDSVIGVEIRTKFSSIGIVGGQKYLTNNFYNQLSTLRDYSPQRPLYYVGVDFSENKEYAPNRKFTRRGFITTVIPQQIEVGNSEHVMLNGFNFGYFGGHDFLFKSDLAELNLMLGFNTGRLHTFGNGSIREKNAYFSPAISVQTGFTSGRVLYTLHVDYEYDISKTGWRRTDFANGTQYNLNTLNQSGFTLGVGIEILKSVPKTILVNIAKPDSN